MKNRYPLFLRKSLIYLCLLIPSIALADTIHMDSGVIIEGEIIEKNDLGVKVKNSQKTIRIPFDMMRPEDASILKSRPDFKIQQPTPPSLKLEPVADKITPLDEPNVDPIAEPPPNPETTSQSPIENSMQLTPQELNYPPKEAAPEPSTEQFDEFKDTPLDISFKQPSQWVINRTDESSESYIQEEAVIYTIQENYNGKVIGDISVKKIDPKLINKNINSILNFYSKYNFFPDTKKSFVLFQTPSIQTFGENELIYYEFALNSAPQTPTVAQYVFVRKPSLLIFTVYDDAQYFPDTNRQFTQALSTLKIGSNIFFINLMIFTARFILIIPFAYILIGFLASYFSKMDRAKIPAVTYSALPPIESPDNNTNKIFNLDKYFLNQKMSWHENYFLYDQNQKEILFIQRERNTNFILLLTLPIAIIIIISLIFYYLLDHPDLLIEIAGIKINSYWNQIFIFLLASAFALWFFLLFFFKRLRHIKIFNNEKKESLIMEILQQHRFPLVRDIFNVKFNGNEIGRLIKNKYTSYFRKEWIVLDSQDHIAAYVLEDSYLLALIRRLMPIEHFGLIRLNFIIYLGNKEKEIGEFNRRFSITDKYVLDLTNDPGRQFDRRLAIALAIILDTGESR